MTRNNKSHARRILSGKLADHLKVWPDEQADASDERVVLALAFSSERGWTFDLRAESLMGARSEDARLRRIVFCSAEPRRMACESKSKSKSKSESKR